MRENWDVLDGRALSGKARMESLSPEERTALATKAAVSRWQAERELFGAGGARFPSNAHRRITSGRKSDSVCGLGGRHARYFPKRDF